MNKINDEITLKGLASWVHISACDYFYFIFIKYDNNKKICL